MLLTLALLRMTLNSKYRKKKIKAKNLRYRNIKIKTEKKKTNFSKIMGRKWVENSYLKKTLTTGNNAEQNKCYNYFRVGKVD